MKNIRMPLSTPASSALATGNGAVMLVGLDTETGQRPADVSHGDIAYWSGVIQTCLLSAVTNGKSDILVIGGHGAKSKSDVKNFWDQVSGKLGVAVTYRHRNSFGTKPVSTVNFNDFALLVVATDHDAKGALHQHELDALNARQQDVTRFLCGGGAVFASSCQMDNPFGYLARFGSIDVGASQRNGASATTEGVAFGLASNTLPNGPWHTFFTRFPGYLKPLCIELGASSIRAVGGKNLSVLTVEFSLSKTNYCLSDPILADASASMGAGQHFWSIQESDAGWNRFGDEISDWFAGAPGTTDLSAFAALKHLKFKCNTYYRIKLAVAGLCTDWLETTQLIRIICPDVDAGPDKCVSCDGGVAQLGLNREDTSNTYQWAPSIGLSQADAANPVHQNYVGQYPITYTVTATAPDGCTHSDEVTLFCRPPTLNLTRTSNCCEVRLTAGARNASHIVWSSGAQDVDEIVTSTGGTYTVTASNACGSVSQSMEVSSIFPLHGDFGPLAHDGAFSPPGGYKNLKDKLYFVDLATGGGVRGTANAYNATQYRLEVRNRWGVLIRTIESAVSCTGFNNWDVNWDGTTDQGELVEHGAYYFLLWFKNCDHPDWTHPLERKWVPAACIEWFTVLGVKLWCKRHDPAGPTWQDTRMTSGVVNVWYR